MSTPKNPNRAAQQHKGPHSPADFDRDRALDGVRYRVLLAIPTDAHIPIFALEVEARRTKYETAPLEDRAPLSRLVGGNLTRRLPVCYGEHHLIQVRVRISPRTVLYSRWLAFPRLAEAEEFVRVNSKFGLKAIRVRTDAEYRKLKAAQEEGLSRGRFDLSRLHPRSRLNRGREFIETTEAVG